MVGRTVNIAEAKAALSELVDAATAGEDVVIARKGKPLVRLTPVESVQPRRPGAAKHWKIPSDLFLRPLSKEDRAWVEGDRTDALGMTKPRRKRRS